MSPRARATLHEQPEAEAAVRVAADRWAHQLGEAAVIVSGYGALLAERPSVAADAEARAAVDALLAAGLRLQRMTDDLLDLGGLASAAPKLEPVAPAPIAREARERDPQLAARVELVVGPVPAVRADRRLLGRLFELLLRDAATATEAPPALVRISGRRDGEHVHVELRDDAGTLSAGRAAAHFDVLAPPRGHGALVGAALGPAVCRRIAELHGGGIRAHPLDGGVEVVLTLPAAT